MRTAKDIEAELKPLVEKAQALNKLQNESGEGFDYCDTPEIRALVRELTEAKFSEEWTKDITMQRRIFWNDAVRANIVGGKIPLSAIPKIEKSLGFRADQLKKAVKMHNL